MLGRVRFTLHVTFTVCTLSHLSRVGSIISPQIPPNKLIYDKKSDNESVSLQTVESLYDYYVSLLIALEFNLNYLSAWIEQEERNE